MSEAQPEQTITASNEVVIEKQTEQKQLPMQTRVLICSPCKTKFNLQYLTKTPKFCPCCGKLAMVEG